MLSNSVTLIGNLGDDMQIRETTGGQTLGTVNIAINNTYTDRRGDTVKDTQWFRLVAWGKVAERMAKTLSKGDKVLIEGRLSANTYETKDGDKRTSVEVNVATSRKLDRPAAGQSASTPSNAQAEEAVPA